MFANINIKKDIKILLISCKKMEVVLIPLLFFLSLAKTILCDWEMHPWIILIAESKLRNDANTMIAIFLVELDNDLSIVTNIIFVNYTKIYGSTNKSTENTCLFLTFCFMSSPKKYCLF